MPTTQNSTGATTWIRRIGFFLFLNIVVVATISIVTSLLGIGPYLTRAGLDYGALVAFCLVWGIGGAFISLMMSKLMAKWMMGVKIVDPQTQNSQMRRLVNEVHTLARTAGLSTMPDVGIYESDEINAFATGPSRSNSLVAVSTGLLNRMDDDSVQGVLGHEVTHIANGDMVTMTLIQGVVNAFVMALARIIAFAIDNALRDRNNRGGLGMFGYMITVTVLQMLLFIPGSMVIAWFSRMREFRADAGGARLAGRSRMVSALRSLDRLSQVNMEVADDAGQAPAFASLKISAGRKQGWLELFASHPPLKERIARLEKSEF